MARVAVVTDSACDLPTELTSASGVTVVPLIVSFGSEEFRSGVDLSMDAFYSRLTAPGAPFPRTAACSPEAFARAFSERLSHGAEAVVCITVGSRLSATHTAATVARRQMADRPIHLIDSRSASMGLGLLVMLAAELARAGSSADEVAAAVRARVADSRLFVALDTLEYLKRGGRISSAKAAIGSLLSVKPIITIDDGVVEVADRPRTRSRARQRVVELLTERPVERAWVLHTQAEGVETFADELSGAIGVPRERIAISLIGPSVAPHVGPGAVGAAVLVCPPEGSQAAAPVYTSPRFDACEPARSTPSE